MQDRKIEMPEIVEMETFVTYRNDFKHIFNQSCRSYAL